MAENVKKSFKLLLIEDEPVIAELIREMISRDRLSKFEISHVLTLKEGLQQLAAGKFAAVLLDLSLPDSQGLQTFKTVSVAVPETPVVILSALNDEAIALEAVKHGAQEYLVKGEVDMKLLPRFIRYAIERQHVETALRKSEERFEIAMRATNDVIWDWDLTTNHVWWSDNIYNLFRYKPEEVRGTPDWWSEHVHPEDKGKFLSSVEAVIHSGWQFWSSEYRFRRADGVYIPVFDRGYVVQDKDGSPTRSRPCAILRRFWPT
jgi:PAS domain S-box-containing protein